MISIHALLAESDRPNGKKHINSRTFLSTLSLRRATSMMLSMAAILILFLSTLSLRRATAAVCKVVSAKLYFYPRSPCGERLLPGRLGFLSFLFLSTLSLRRATVVKMSIKFFNADFYPRSPCGERRFPAGNLCPVRRISIHALLAESD